MANIYEFLLINDRNQTATPIYSVKIKISRVPGQSFDGGYPYLLQSIYDHHSRG
ncbi:hypothetical protein J7J00_07750 [Bacillus sp. ISL-4]|uniref:hypothetical protein n=1 Tax=Bacillus sp. ISL-4 TaxID=2819125 RepID=UPI001BE9FC6F|nr:hypothetical protein [Bacillus sp. ISL-4]MBT2665386.1 hypothetical protein [Bacillus sp. ISL-4]